MARTERIDSGGGAETDSGGLSTESTIAIICPTILDILGVLEYFFGTVRKFISKEEKKPEEEVKEERGSTSTTINYFNASGRQSMWARIFPKRSNTNDEQMMGQTIKEEDTIAGVEGTRGDLGETGHGQLPDEELSIRPELSATFDLRHKHNKMGETRSEGNGVDQNHGVVRVDSSEPGENPTAMKR